MHPFVIILHTFFGIDFCIDFRRRFGYVLSPKWLQKGPTNRPKTAPKTHPKKQRKNDAELQPDGVLDLVSKLVGRKAHFFETWMLSCRNWFVHFRKLVMWQFPFSPWLRLSWSSVYQGTSHNLAFPFCNFHSFFPIILSCSNDQKVEGITGTLV